MEPIMFPDIKRQVLSIDKTNVAWQFYDDGFLIKEFKIVSKNPFVISSNGIQYFLTNNEDYDLSNEYEYILLTSKKPTVKNISDNSLIYKRWLNHPKFRILSPGDIIASWKDGFHFIQEDESNNIKGLRQPQMSALHSILAHLRSHDGIHIIVMPTGTGKTETMLAALIQGQCNKLLITVPSDALRMQISDKCIRLGLLKQFGIVDNSCYNPIVGIINTRFSSMNNLTKFISSVNVIVATMDILVSFSEQEKELLSKNCSNVFVDEAHHSEASTWKDLIEKFEKDKVFLFTATPYRNDGKSLQGTIISKFSLKMAQEQKYYKEINYLPIREYDKKKADKKIAEKAVAQLKKDIKNGYKHIVMARCKDKKRAIEVFEYYNVYSDLNPILIYSGMKKLNEKIKSIKNGCHSIIVCVNMLGEGFDLPQLKIAAIHDERQSLPITLQFIGRFTRSSYDILGKASFITNIAYPPIHDELDELYARDADWNLILPRLSDNATQKEVDLMHLMESFNFDNSKIPFQSIRPAMSTVIYHNTCVKWNANNWEEGIENINNYEYKFSSSNENSIIIILGKFNNVEWGNFDTVRDLEWHIIVVYWDLRSNVNRIFVNTSIAGLNIEKLLKSIFDDNIKKINGREIFRIFYDVKRLSLFNLGARKGIGRDITFQSFYGKGVQDGIKEIEENRLIKNNIFGIGYKNGEKISLGCSIKGKIWSYRRGNLNELFTWCRNVGDIVDDEAIDPDTVLKNTLQIQKIYVRPSVIPIAIDWDPERYEFADSGYIISINETDYDLSEFELSIVDREIDESLQFSLDSVDYQIVFDIELGKTETGGKTDYYCKIKKITGIDVVIKHGSFVEGIEKFFDENTPTIWFADESFLFQNNYVELKERIDFIPLKQIFVDDWNGVAIEKESQDIYPYIQNSIQYYFINKIKDDFDIIYDDDGKGEIADIIGIKDSENEINVHLYHLKYAMDGCVSNNIKNFYEVCGQAQKSLGWKRKKRRVFFDHLFKRMDKTLNGRSCSRIIKGTEVQLEYFFNAAKWRKDIIFHICIVQPGLSKANASDDILRLLGVTYHYLYTVGNVELIVYSSN